MKRTTPVFSKKWQRKRIFNREAIRQGKRVMSAMKLNSCFSDFKITSVDPVSGIVNVSFVYHRPVERITFTSFIDPKLLEKLHE